MAPPRIYTRELSDDVLTRLADGISLAEICRAPDMPSRTSVWEWIRDDVDGFAGRYAHARETQAHALVDDLMRIADDATEDPQRSRLRLDARKWAASKILPKVYGDKTILAGDETAPLVVQIVNFTDDSNENHG